MCTITLMFVILLSGGNTAEPGSCDDVSYCQGGWVHQWQRGWWVDMAVRTEACHYQPAELCGNRVFKSHSLPHVSLTGGQYLISVFVLFIYLFINDHSIQYGKWFYKTPTLTPAPCGSFTGVNLWQKIHQVDVFWLTAYQKGIYTTEAISHTYNYYVQDLFLI